MEKCKFPKDGSSPKSLRYIGRYYGYEPGYYIFPGVGMFSDIWLLACSN